MIKEFSKKLFLIGKVINNKIKKTLIVLVIFYSNHPIYKKKIIKKKKYFVHNPFEKDYPLNSFVKFEKSRPISKKKHWILEKNYL